MDCVECQLTVCPKNCPNFLDRPKVYECLECGENICEGDEYFKINEENYCKECIEEMRCYA